MEVLEFFAHGYCSIMASLGQLACQLRGMAAGTTFRVDPYEKIGLALGALEREATTLNLPASKKQVQRLLDTINKHGHGNVSDEQIAIAILGIIERTVDELEERTFLLIPKETASLFLDGQPFGAKVHAKFSSFTEDITEASRCLSFNRPTATVFHLMRVMERAVQTLATDLQVTNVETKYWQTLLDQINAAVRKLDPKTDIRAPKLAKASAHLYNVKVAWRNEVMHPKQTYTMEEAMDIYKSVKVFVGTLADII